MRALYPQKRQPNPKKIMLPLMEDSNQSMDSLTKIIKDVFKTAHKALKPVTFEDNHLHRNLAALKRLNKKIKDMKK